MVCVFGQCVSSSVLQQEIQNAANTLSWIDGCLWAIGRVRERCKRKDLGMAPAWCLFSKGGHVVDIQPPFHLVEMTLLREVSGGECVHLRLWKVRGKSCRIHSAALRGPMTLQINVPRWLSFVFLVAFRSGHSGTGCLNGCLCKHTSIGWEQRETLTPPSTPEALGFDLVASQFTCEVDEEAPLAAGTGWARTAVRELGTED